MNFFEMPRVYFFTREKTTTKKTDLKQKKDKNKNQQECGNLHSHTNTDRKKITNLKNYTHTPHTPLSTKQLISVALLSFLSL